MCVPHRAIVNLYFYLPQPSVMLVYCQSVCVPHRAIVNLYFYLPQPSVMLVQCVSPIELLSTQCDVGPVCVPHRAIVSILLPASTQCDVGPVCVPHRAIVNRIFNLPQPSVMLVQCVSPIELLSIYTSTCLNPV